MNSITNENTTQALSSEELELVSGGVFPPWVVPALIITIAAGVKHAYDSGSNQAKRDNASGLPCSG